MGMSFTCPTCNVPAKHGMVHCPDMILGCAVAHYGWVCPSCGVECGPVFTGQKRKEVLVLGPDAPKAEPIGYTLEEKVGLASVAVERTDIQDAYSRGRYRG